MTTETLHRAYAKLQIKAMRDDERVIEGIASTPSTDRVGDIVEPMGVRMALPLPLLWQHRHDMPIGQVEWAKPNAKGIPFRARIFKASESDVLRERLDEAWESIKLGLVRAVSIGFGLDDYELMENGGWRIKGWEWRELSAVTIPANADCTITSIKSIDRQLRAASGTLRSERPRTPARDRAIPRQRQQETTKMATLSEQISALEHQEKNLVAQLNKFDVDAMDEAAEERFDDLDAELGEVRKKLKRLERLETINVEKKAQSVEKANDADRGQRKAAYGSQGRARAVDLPKGVNFARYAMCLGMAKGIDDLAITIAEKAYGDDKRVANYARLKAQKAAVPAAFTGDTGGWAEDIAEAQTVAGEFIEFLRPMSLVDRLADRMRRVPFNVKVSRMTTGQTGYWVGEALPAPLTAGVFDTVQLGKTKVGTIAALSREQMRFSNINAELAVRDDLARAVVARLDSTFISNAAASAGVSPAGLLNGVTGVATSGATADNVRTDLVNLHEAFSAANISRQSLAYVTTENLEFALMVMKSTLGVNEFPEVAQGNLMGRPLIASNHVGGGNLIAISAENILLADDGEVSIEFSDQASLEMLDGSLVQTGQAGTGASLVSLFQSGLVGIKVERFINWAKARDAAVKHVTGAVYQGAASA